MRPLGHYRAFLGGCAGAIKDELPEVAGAMVIVFIPKGDGTSKAHAIGVASQGKLSAPAILNGVKQLAEDMLEEYERRPAKGGHDA